MEFPYELLVEIFKVYASLPGSVSETLLQVCSSWSAVASHEASLWTKFVISEDMVRSTGPHEDATLTRDWVGIFKRRLARAGPSRPLEISILALHRLLLPVVDVISGTDYVHLSRWETLNIEADAPITIVSTWGSDENWTDIGYLISHRMPSLRRLTLCGSNINFHAFGGAHNLEELNVLHSQSPRIGRNNSFPNLKILRITYPPKYPLCFIPIHSFSLQTIQTLVIGGDVELPDHRGVEGTYPSLSRLEFTERIPWAIYFMSAPCLRHLILHSSDLFCHQLRRPLPAGMQFAANRRKNKGLLMMLAGTFSTVEVLEVHQDLRNLVLKMVMGEKQLFIHLCELWVLSKDIRKRINLDR